MYMVYIGHCTEKSLKRPISFKSNKDVKFSLHLILITNTIQMIVIMLVCVISHWVQVYLVHKYPLSWWKSNPSLYWENTSRLNLNTPMYF